MSLVAVPERMAVSSKSNPIIESFGLTGRGVKCGVLGASRDGEMCVRASESTLQRSGVLIPQAGLKERFKSTLCSRAGCYTMSVLVRSTISFDTKEPAELKLKWHELTHQSHLCAYYLERFNRRVVMGRSEGRTCAKGVTPLAILAIIHGATQDYKGTVRGGHRDLSGVPAKWKLCIAQPQSNALNC